MGRGKEEREISKVIFDTDVLIWYFRGKSKAMEFIVDVPFEERCVSSLCIMELIQGCLSKDELKKIKGFVKENICHIVYPDEAVSNKAILLLERHASSDNLRTIDAMIAATAILIDASLATANIKHFKNISTLKIKKFSP